MAPTSVCHDKKGSDQNLVQNGQRSTVIIGLPIAHRKKRIQGCLNHELGTHLLRKINDNQQMWSQQSLKNQRKMLKLKQYATTEEGLAALNQLIDIA